MSQITKEATRRGSENEVKTRQSSRVTTKVRKAAAENDKSTKPGEKGEKL